MNSPAPKSVGLGGDGDEIAAVQKVERSFGIQFDHGDAPQWVTAGDVFSSLLRALPPKDAAIPTLWSRFATIITSETGVDPTSIKPESFRLTPGCLL